MHLKELTLILYKVHDFSMQYSMSFQCLESKNYKIMTLPGSRNPMYGLQVLIIFMSCNIDFKTAVYWPL